MGRDRTKALFIEYLFYLFEMNKSDGNRAVYLITREMDTIAPALRMGALLEARQQVAHASG
jgi:hypothetical protein